MKWPNLQHPRSLSIEANLSETPVGDGGKPLLQDDKPVEYTFAKLGEGDKAIDAPADLVTKVTEFARTHKLSNEQAQAVLADKFASKGPEVPAEYVFAKVKDDKGADVDVDKALSDPIASFAKENGLTQPQAQKLMDRELSMQSVAEKQFEKETQDMVTKWRDESQNHPLLKQGNFQENLGMAKEALKAFFPALAANVADHLFLENPEIIAGLYLVQKKVSEDKKIISGSTTTEKQPGDLSDMYPTMYEKKLS